MPDSRLHPFWRLVLCAVVLLMAVVVVQAVGVGLLLAFAKPLGFGNLPLDKRITEIATNYGLHLTILSYPIGVAILYLFRTKVDKYSWRSLGFSRVRALPDLLRGALTALLTLSVLFALMYVAGAIRFGGWSSDVQTHSGFYAVGSLLFFAVGFGAVGLFEELVFRGYGLANLRQFIGWGGAVVVQAAFFAFIHLGNGLGKPDVFKAALAGLPSLFLIAVFFALSYRKTGSLWFPIGFHIAWDWLLGCVFSLPVSGIPIFHLFDVQETSNSFLSGGAFGAESSFFLIPLLLAMIYALWLVPDHPRAVANLDRPETMDEAEQTPLYAPYSAPVATTSTGAYAGAQEEEDGPRENRYRARFGSGEGFDSGMLSELKQMHEERERAERERLDAEKSARRAEEMRLEEIRRAQLVAQAEVQSQAQATAIAIAEAEQGKETMPAPTPTSVQEPVAPVVSEVKAKPAPVAPTVAPPRIPVAAVEAEAPVAVTPENRPTRPVAPAPLPPVTKQPDPAPETPKEPAPPKKARPRW